MSELDLIFKIIFLVSRSVARFASKESFSYRKRSLYRLTLFAGVKTFFKYSVNLKKKNEYKELFSLYRFHFIKN